MKLVEGKTLSELIATQKTQRDLERILQSLVKVCDALSFAHSRGVIHRDLKPDNIMVGSHGQVYVMDWGCAQVIGDDRSIVEGRVDPDGIVIGTVAYMAPEQARGEIGLIDQRTDVFGVGGILYKALTGSPPYPGPVMAALMRAQMGDVQPPDESTGVAVKPPPHLSQIAMKAMAARSAEALPDRRGARRGPARVLARRQLVPAAQVRARSRDRPRRRPAPTPRTSSPRAAARSARRDPKDPSRTVTLRTLAAGDVFGETAIFADAPRSASVVAIEDVSAVVVDRAAIDNLTRSSWLGLFVKALADRFLDVDARLSKSR